MDIHELRQFESVYKPSKEVAFCWLRKQYVQLSTEGNHTEIVDNANDSLRIWQAAKAQAVPEGYVVLRISDVREILSNASDAMCDEAVSTVFSETGIPSTWYDHHYVAEKNIIDAIEAQEPANESE